MVRVSTEKSLDGMSVEARPWCVEARKGPFVGDIHDAVLLCKRRSNCVPPVDRRSVVLGADPSQIQSGVSSSTVDLFSSVGCQLTAAALVHGSSAPVVHNCSAV